MKKVGLIVCAFVLIFSSGSMAQTIFQDNFGSAGPDAAWGAGLYAGGVFGANGSMSTITGETNWLGTTINPPAGNTDGYIGKIEHAATTYATSYRIVDSTEADYTIEVEMYTEIVNTPDEPDDYHYCQVIFYESADGYGRYHTHLNEDTSILPNGPRIRVQTAHGGFQTLLEVFSPTTFTAAEGWHTFRIEIQDKVATCFYDGANIGIADFSAVANADNGGFGVGQFVDGDTGGVARAAYFDDFIVTQTDGSVDDWTLYE